MKEKEIENSILSYLQHTPGLFWKNQSVGIFDPVRKTFRKNRSKYHINGVADILGMLPNGRFVAIEVKTKTGRLSKDQKLFLENVNDNNGIGFVARSIGDVEAVLYAKKETKH